jgi:hypothetical protein
MTTFRDFRDKVSILQLAEYLGYKPVAGKSTKARPVLSDASGDTILIKNPTNPSLQLYWNTGNSLQHGSVIDFVKNNISRFAQRGRNEVDSINLILSHFSGVVYDNTKYLDMPVHEQKSFTESDYRVEKPTVEQLHYLTRERGLSRNTVETFLPFIRIVTENNGYKNIAFPFTTPDNQSVRGYEMRNYNFKSFSAGGDKINSAWIANFSNVNSEVSKVFFFESAIDAMSFYEMRPIPFDLEKTVFVSEGGYPCKNQFLNVINTFPNAVCYGCHDNDISGHLFDIELACSQADRHVIKNKQDDGVRFTFDNVMFVLKNEKVNLANFLKKSRLLSDVKSLKPVKCKDWNEALNNKLTESKKPVFTVNR